MYVIMVPLGRVYVRVSVETSVEVAETLEVGLLVEDATLTEKNVSIEESSTATLNFIIARSVTAPLLKDIERYRNSSAFMGPSPM